MRAHALTSRAKVASPKAHPTAQAPGPARPEVRQILHTPGPQAKLTVGAPDDAFEKEADQVADQVMRMPEPGVQRMCSECEEESEARISRKESAPGPAPGVPGGFEQRFAALHGGGQPLPASERAFFEPRFGRDFSNVRLHSGSAASELARSVHARAFTLGDSIVLGAGEGGESGRELLAHELTHVVQQGGGAEQVQRVVDFQADFSNISVAAQAAAAIASPNFTYADAAFSANADVTATGDTEAELNQWDVGVFQDMVVNWEREYWRRNNSDGRGRYVEQKFLPVNTRFRDQASGATTIWSDDSEHQDLSTVAKTPAGARFQAAATIVTSDNPGGQDTIDGSGVTGMDASDGTSNVDIQRIGSRFDTWISAHNTVTNEFRHLRRLNWNYMRSLDFTGSGGTLAVGPESGQVGHHGPYGAGKDAPLTAGTTANTAMGNNANWARRRVNGWT